MAVTGSISFDCALSLPSFLNRGGTGRWQAGEAPDKAEGLAGMGVAIRMESNNEACLGCGHLPDAGLQQRVFPRCGP